MVIQLAVMQGLMNIPTPPNDPKKVVKVFSSSGRPELWITPRVSSRLFSPRNGALG